MADRLEQAVGADDLSRERERSVGRQRGVVEEAVGVDGVFQESLGVDRFARAKQRLEIRYQPRRIATQDREPGLALVVVEIHRPIEVRADLLPALLAAWSQ